jgi:hypothetical protein
VLALATIGVGIVGGLDVQLVVVAAVLVLPLLAERARGTGTITGGRGVQPPGSGEPRQGAAG